MEDASLLFLRAPFYSFFLPFLLLGTEYNISLLDSIIHESEHCRLEKARHHGGGRETGYYSPLPLLPSALPRDTTLIQQLQAQSAVLE